MWRHFLSNVLAPYGIVHYLPRKICYQEWKYLFLIFNSIRAIGVSEKMTSFNLLIHQTYLYISHTALSHIFRRTSFIHHLGFLSDLIESTFSNFLFCFAEIQLLIIFGKRFNFWLIDNWTIIIYIITVAIIIMHLDETVWNDNYRIVISLSFTIPCKRAVCSELNNSFVEVEVLINTVVTIRSSSWLNVFIKKNCVF